MMNLDEWILSDDTGLSSKALWAVAKGITPPDGYSYPLDCWDFNRCYRFLHECFQTDRERQAILNRIRRTSIGWFEIVARWDKMSKLYNGKYVAKITRLLDEAIAKGGD